DPFFFSSRRRHTRCLSDWSSDVCSSDLDTTLGLLLRDAADKLLLGVDRALAVIKTRAFEHRRTVMVGRSHGIHAEPISFGHKLRSEERRVGKEWRTGWASAAANNKTGRW